MVKSSLCAILVSLLIYALERRVKLMKELDRRCTRHYDQKFRIYDSSYTAGQGWGGLYRAWQGLLINKTQSNL